MQSRVVAYNRSWTFAEGLTAVLGVTHFTKGTEGRDPNSGRAGNPA
jgi:hypothetical protein